MTILSRVVFVASSLAITLPRSDVHAAGLQSVLLDRVDSGSNAREIRRRGERLADYGSFQLWAARTRPTRASEATHTLWHRGGRQIDTRRSMLPLRVGRSPGTDSLVVVQFAGPVHADWLRKLHHSGTRIVAYLPQDAYVLSLRSADRIKVDALLASAAVRWIGEYDKKWRVAPELLAASVSDRPVSVAVQLVQGPAAKATLRELEQVALGVVRRPRQIGGLLDMVVILPPDKIRQVASWSGVFDLSRWSPPVMRDELQGKVFTGSWLPGSTGIQPTGEGYLPWLRAQGVPEDPTAYPIVDVVDDGVEEGGIHPDLHELGSVDRPSRVVFSNDCTTGGAAPSTGHGTFNAGILAGFAQGDSTTRVDPAGFHRGLGISPFGRIGSSRVFRGETWDNSGCGDLPGLLRRSWMAGARITTNSWSIGSASEYDLESRLYDALTRDAVPDSVGNQEMLHIFSAGNRGPAGGSIDAPALAKNVIAVGASEGGRDPGVVDGCAISQASTPENIASFSGRGPTQMGRMKPELVAPGTHIAGLALQKSQAIGKRVCAATNDMFYPLGQTLYTWSSGTSHAAPAVAGVAQLAYELYGRRWTQGSRPSPAMMRAILVHHSRSLQGWEAADDLPSPNQGWGTPDLSSLYDTATRILDDQTSLFTATGQVREIIGLVTDPGRSTPITLAWTDAPGQLVGSPAWVNDLDLEVEAGGQVYRGNHFSGAISVPGGQSDPRNNLERVVLPVGIDGMVRIRVIARNIAGEGVPGNNFREDQDFALIATNLRKVPAPELSVRGSLLVLRNPQTEFVHPGDSLLCTLSVANPGGALARAVRGTIEVLDPHGRIFTEYLGDLPVGDTARVVRGIRLPDSLPCGQDLRVSFSATDGPDSGAQLIALPGPRSNRLFEATQVPMSILDDRSTRIPLFVRHPGVVGGIRIGLELVHSFIGDLRLSIVSPSGKRILLEDRHGGAGGRMHNTVFDIASQTPIGSGLPPFEGQFRPEGDLTTLLGERIEGEWSLLVEDLAAGDDGRMDRFWIEFTGMDGTCPVVASVPTGLVAIARDGGVKLRWDAVPGAASYVVSRQNPSGNISVFSVGAPSFDDAGLRNGSGYSYRVASKNLAGTSVFSPPITTIPVAPLLLTALYKPGNLLPKDALIRAQIALTNHGPSMELKNVTIRYWFTRESSSKMDAQIEWAPMGRSAVSASTIPLPGPRVGADSYLEIGFRSGVLATGATTGGILLRAQKTDRSVFDETDDWSYDPAAQSLTQTSRITVYVNGVKVWGEEPSGR